MLELKVKGVKREHVDSVELEVDVVMMAFQDLKEIRDSQAQRVHKVKWVFRVWRVLGELLECQAIQEHPENKAHLE